MFKTTLNEYYSKRAKEYDSIYKRPDKIRLKEQKFLADYIASIFKGKYVLEIACGTGYWTKYLLKSAKKILATDYSEEMLEVASHLLSKNSKITLLQADAYNPPTSLSLCGNLAP